MWYSMDRDLVVESDKFSVLKAMSEPKYLAKCWSLNALPFQEKMKSITSTLQKSRIGMQKLKAVKLGNRSITK